MFRVRFHGRGGQGTKTASHILGNAFFLEGYEVQDAPRYGAERRGAPIFAYVRAARDPINERGVIRHPDLVIVVDESLVPVPAAEVLFEVSPHTTLLINSREPPETWRERLKFEGPILTLPISTEVMERSDVPYLGATCAGAAASLVGVIKRESLEEAIAQEIAPLGEAAVAADLEKALAAFDAMDAHKGCVIEGKLRPEAGDEKPDWIDLPLEGTDLSAPAIYGGGTSVEVKTGLWRVLRPVVHEDHCNRCVWICSSLCPDSAINVSKDGYPDIDYDHCKGCMICVAACPRHAIEAVPEHAAAATAPPSLEEAKP